MIVMMIILYIIIIQNKNNVSEIVSSDIESKLSRYEQKIKKLSESNKKLKEKLKNIPNQNTNNSESYKSQINSILEEKRNLQFLLSKFNTQLSLSQHKLEKLNKQNGKYKAIIEKLKNDNQLSVLNILYIAQFFIIKNI